MIPDESLIQSSANGVLCRDLQDFARCFYTEGWVGTDIDRNCASTFGNHVLIKFSVILVQWFWQNRYRIRASGAYQDVPQDSTRFWLSFPSANGGFRGNIYQKLIGEKLVKFFKYIDWKSSKPDMGAFLLYLWAVVWTHLEPSCWQRLILALCRTHVLLPTFLVYCSHLRKTSEFSAASRQFKLMSDSSHT